MSRVKSTSVGAAVSARHENKTAKTARQARWIFINGEVITVTAGEPIGKYVGARLALLIWEDSDGLGGSLVLYLRVAHAIIALRLRPF